jgi:hypothetical protein
VDEPFVAVDQNACPVPPAIRWTRVTRPLGTSSLQTAAPLDAWRTYTTVSPLIDAWLYDQIGVCSTRLVTPWSIR